MEDDVDMENGYGTDYPDPSADSPTPYPVITQESGFSAIVPATANGYESPYTVMPFTPLKGTVPAYTSLAEYFNIGNISQGQLRTADDDAGVTEDYESEYEDQRNGAWELRNIDSINEDHYSSPEPQDRSLPGFHALPEIDTRYPVQNRQPGYVAIQPQSTTPGRSGRPRTRERGSGRGRGGRQRGSWKAVIGKTEHADLFKAPRLPRDPTARNRGRKRGRAAPKHIDPGDEYKRLASLANHSFFEGNLEQALEYIFEAIRTNPEVYHGHLLFSEILEKQGRPRDAVYAITNGAAVKRDAEVWVAVAERYLNFDDKDQDHNDILSALRCYHAAMKLDVRNCAIREAKLTLHLELEDWISARAECRNLVRLRPGELDYVRQYASLCNMTGRLEDRERAVSAYETAFFKRQGDQTPLNNLDEYWDHLNVYLDLLHKMNRATQGLKQAKQLARWFLGRKDDTFWDNFDIDDREFDTDDDRRNQIGQYQQVGAGRDPMKYGGGLPLDIRVKMGLFRTQMGLMHQPEAQRHFEHLRRLSSEAESYVDMFFDVAECMRTHRFPQTAITYYESIKAFPELVAEDFWIGLAICYETVGRNSDAEECFLKTIEVSEDHIEARLALVKLYESTNERSKAHSFASELVELGQKEMLVREKIKVPRGAKNKTNKAQSNGSVTAKTQHSLIPLRPAGVIVTRRSSANGPHATLESDGELGLDGHDPYAVRNVRGDAGNRKTSSGQHAIITQAIQEQKERVQANYSKVKELWPAFESHEDEESVQQWIHHAQGMAEDFRATKEFFPRRARERYFAGLMTGKKTDGRTAMREMMAVKKSLQNGVSNDTGLSCNGSPFDFHGISFAEWHRILATLSLAYADQVDQDRSYDILQKILMKANVFIHDPALKNTTLAVCICCALMFNDHKFAAETVRHYDFPGLQGSAKASQLLVASGRLGHGDGPFYHKDTQRWAQLAVKQQDFLAMSPDMRSTVDWGDDEDRLNKLARNSDGAINELDPGLMATHAHITAHRQGPTNAALSYLFRALAVQPENIVVNLSIAVTYLNASLQKDVGDRQHIMAQGQAFLYRYYDLRVASGSASHIQEAEFNMGRAWQMVGWPHVAVPAYEKAMGLSEQVLQEAQVDGTEREVEDFAKEAAFALRSMFIAAGNEVAARVVTEQWLVI